MSEMLLKALALAMVLEGIGPFLIPGRWRQMMVSVARLPEPQLRVFGAVVMGLGVLLLQLVGR